MPRYMLTEYVTQYYVVDAETEEEAIETLYTGEVDPVTAHYSDDVTVKEITEE